MKPQVYADSIERSVGIHKAFEMAKNARETTKRENWGDLPVGPIFHDKMENSQWRLKEKSLIKLAAFWDNVFGILRKKAVAKGIKV